MHKSDDVYMLVSWARRCVYFFFFKQKTAYEIMPSLVGSEMCIRDSCRRNILTSGS